MSQTLANPKQKIQIDPINFSPELISKIEEGYSAKFICESEVKGIPILLFYSKEKHRESGSHYFAIFIDRNHFGKPITFITNGQQCAEESIFGIKGDNEEIVYSRYQHHMNETTDGTAWIDGGKAYTRCSDPHRLVELVIKDDELGIKE